MPTLELTIIAPHTLNKKMQFSVQWLNANDRTHWARRANLVRAWRTRAQLAAASARLPKNIGPSHITATIHKTRGGRWDAHNLTPTAKAIVDGLTDYGLWPDDNNDYVTGPDMRAGEPRERACVVLTITPIEERP